MIPVLAEISMYQGHREASDLSPLTSALISDQTGPFPCRGGLTSILILDIATSVYSGNQRIAGQAQTVVEPLSLRGSKSKTDTSSTTP